MRIGIIHGDFQTLGGSEKVAMSIIKSLKQSGHSINLYFVNHTNDDKIQKVFKEILPLVRIHKIFQLNTKRFLAYQTLFNRILLTKAGNKDDIVIETSGVLHPLWFTSKPYIVYCNGFTKKTIFDIQSKTNLKKIYMFLYKKILKKIQKKKSIIQVIANSNYTQKLLKENLNINSKVIYPPVNLNRFDCKDFKKISEVIIFSRFSREKNHELAIEIAENLDEKFIFIGNVGEPKYYERIKSIILKKNLSNNIKLIPNGSTKEINERLCEAKTYLHTGQESFGITVIEAISAGCIPIVPDSSSHKETVPFEELRYKNIEEAKWKLKKALEGEFDYFIPKLKDHIKQFNEKYFERQLMCYLEKVHKDFQVR